MLTQILSLLEHLGANGGATTALGRGTGLAGTLGNLLGGGGAGPQAFADQNELGGAFSQISNLQSSLSAAQISMKESRDEHERLRLKVIHDNQYMGFSDPQAPQQMAALQRQQMENARQQQLDQQNMQNLQARAAITMNPDLQAQQARGNVFRQAGALAIGGQIAQSYGPSAMRSIGGMIPGVGAAAELGSFAMGHTNSQIIGGMGNQAAQGVSNVVGGTMQGASMGMAVGGPAGALAGAAIGGIASASTEIAKLPARIVNWSESLLDSQRSISRFSAVMAQAEAQRNVRKLMRDFDSAQQTGGRTAELSHTLDDLYDELQPIRNATTNVLASGLTHLVRSMADLTALAKKIAESDAMWTAMSMALGPTVTALLQAIANNTAPTSVGGAHDAKFAIALFKHEDKTKPRQAPRR